MGKCQTSYEPAYEKTSNFPACSTKIAAAQIHDSGIHGIYIYIRTTILA